MWLKSPFLSGKTILFFPSPAAIKEFASWKLGLLVALVNSLGKDYQVLGFFSVLDLTMPFFGSKGMLI